MNDNEKQIESERKREWRKYDAATSYGYAVAGGSPARPAISQAFIEGATWADEHPAWQWVDAKEQKPPQDQWVLLHLCISGTCHYTWQGCWDGERWVERTDISVGNPKGFEGLEVLHWLAIPSLNAETEEE